MTKTAKCDKCGKVFKGSFAAQGLVGHKRIVHDGVRPNGKWLAKRKRGALKRKMGVAQKLKMRMMRGMPKPPFMDISTDGPCGHTLAVITDNPINRVCLMCSKVYTLKLAWV